MSCQNEETRSDGDLRTDIWSTLQELDTPSAFAFSAVRPSLPSPGLYVPPYGLLGLPLSTDDAQKIILQARQSPFGKGEETVVDTGVRKSWELNPKQFSLNNPNWHGTIREILDSVTTGLGLKKGMGNISAEVYKLLIYEPGAFFKMHKDTEKTPGMFATLIICLPSPHEGGKLVMTLGNEKYEFDTAKSSTYDFSFASWYSDILHEVYPVTSGYRVVLTYNLIRQTDFEVPSYHLVRGRAQQLTILLKQYNLRLKQKDDNLPPFLVHKLKHQYTTASLQLKSLKPQDLAQVSTLAELAAKLNFCIYLATLELEVNTDEEYSDCEEKEQCLKNIVDLDGKLLLDELNCREDALIDPIPQDAGEADEENHEGYTGNEGCPVTLWYRDTVVVLVPPSKKFSFLFQFSSNGAVIEPLFNKLMQEYSKDQAKKQKLENLCKRALRQNVERDSIPPFFQQAAATALDLGCFDLFDKASEKTGGKISFDNARMLGCWAAKNGVAAMSDRLMKGMQAGSSVAKVVEFLKIVAEGFETVSQEPGSTKQASLKQWSDEAIFSAVANLTNPTKSDAISLAQLCKTIDWSLFESKVKPVISKAAIIFKILFINELMSILQQELNEEQQSFIEAVIQNIWIAFVFNLTQEGSAPKNIKDLNSNEIRSIVENTIKILSSESLETIIIPAMLSAIPNASKECSKEVFIPLTRMIVKNELIGFRLPTNHAVPPLLHKRLVQAFLLKYLKENVGLEPQAPANWSQPPAKPSWGGPCRCEDCAAVNRFLQNPNQKSLDIKCAQQRRRHLQDQFFNPSHFDCETVSGQKPYIWRITKNWSIYEKAKTEWIKNTETAVQTLSELKKDEPADGRLEMYLQPYFGSFMNASLKGVPDLASVVTAAQSAQTDENVTPAHNATASTDQTVQIGQKRGASQTTTVPTAKRSCQS